MQTNAYQRVESDAESKWKHKYVKLGLFLVVLIGCLTAAFVAGSFAHPFSVESPSTNDVAVESDRSARRASGSEIDCKEKEHVCGPKSVLYVWQANELGDHVAAVNYEENSKQYGVVIGRSFLPNNVASIAPTGNEPHHLALTADGTILVTAGLGSFLQGKDQVFVWTIDSSTRVPSFSYSLNVPGLGCPDEFAPLNQEKTLFAVTMMCNSQGVAPGGVVLFDLKKKTIVPWQKGPVQSETTFNPHGADYEQKWGLIAADYIQPASLFSPPPFVFRDTLHHFNSDGTFNGTIVLPTTNGGYMDFHYSPKKGKTHFGVTCSTNGNKIYRVNALDHKDVVEMIDLAKALNEPIKLSAGIFHFSDSGNRLLMTFQLRYVLLLGFDDAFSKGYLIQKFDFCKDVGKKSLIDFNKICNETGNAPAPHYSFLSPDESTYVVTNYFIRIGNVQASGSHSIHSFQLKRDKKTGEIDGFDYDDKFRVDLSLGADYPSYPHGVTQVHRK